MFKYIILMILISNLAACSQDIRQNDKKSKSKNMNYEINKTDDEWKAELTPEQYYVLRHKGTEKPFAGEYDMFFEKGSYHCAGCGNLIFTSDTKFDSHCGWPSFSDAVKGSVEEHPDSSYGMHRTEIVCALCGGHLGHVFDDGPDPTGMRYCINSVSLEFKKEEKLPQK